MSGSGIPIDEVNRPRGAKDAQLWIPPTEPEAGALFTGRGGEPATCRKTAPAWSWCSPEPNLASPVRQGYVGAPLMMFGAPARAVCGDRPHQGGAGRGKGDRPRARARTTHTRAAPASPSLAPSPTRPQ
ncbi:hypothetical protein GCM10009654_31010 [Streptomyces hebeiensis]|uniref:Uncharacterized protein n=1 Tax=Streptomyces hebeiensis TaxID=229486 RepID=A0ABN1UWR3_9ACTN